MKKSDAIKKIQAKQNSIAVKHTNEVRELEARMDLENKESNYNRARSITVGTAFGGTAELMMRGDGGRHLWCVMQPVEVIELIHQLCANVGVTAQLKPREDFSSWREWRVSEAEKKHLNGHPPFVNDMIIYQKLGASGYNDEEAKNIMNVLSEIKEYANEDDESKILLRDTESDGAPNLMIGEKDGLLHNKVAIDSKGQIISMSGGDGGNPIGHLKKARKNEAMAAKKSNHK